MARATKVTRGGKSHRIEYNPVTVLRALRAHVASGVLVSVFLPGTANGKSVWEIGMRHDYDDVVEIHSYTLAEAHALANGLEHMRRAMARAFIDTPGPMGSGCIALYHSMRQHGADADRPELGNMANGMLDLLGANG